MQNPNISIRLFDKADTETLSAIWFDASLVVHPFIGEARLREQRKLIEDVYLPNAQTWVACQAGTPVGFISLLDSFIGGLFVDPSCQGQGIGRKLIAKALKSRKKLSLDVYTRNEQALRFYTALGFQELSRRPTDDEGLPFENAHLHLKR